MNDERERLDVDEWLRSVVAPAPGVAERVARRAAARSGRRRHIVRRVLAAAALMGVATLIAASGALRDRSSAGPPSVAVTRQSGLVVVQRSDGRRWIVGPSAAPPHTGNYAIVVLKEDQR
jgi:hypothetical protein